MEQSGEKITLQFNEQGDLVSTDLGGGTIDKPTNNLHKNPPPGQYLGSMDLGKIYVYKQADGSFIRCFHFRCNLY
jgi:hypothetical protein